MHYDFEDRTLWNKLELAHAVNHHVQISNLNTTLGEFVNQGLPPVAPVAPAPKKKQKKKKKVEASPEDLLELTKDAANLEIMRMPNSLHCRSLHLKMPRRKSSKSKNNANRSKCTTLPGKPGKKIKTNTNY